MSLFYEIILTRMFWTLRVVLPNGSKEASTLHCVGLDTEWMSHIWLKEKSWICRPRQQWQWCRSRSRTQTSVSGSPGVLTLTETLWPASGPRQTLVALTFTPGQAVMSKSIYRLPVSGLALSPIDCKEGTFARKESWAKRSCFLFRDFYLLQTNANVFKFKKDWFCEEIIKSLFLLFSSCCHLYFYNLLRKVYKRKTIPGSVLRCWIRKWCIAAEGLLPLTVVKRDERERVGAARLWPDN